MTAPTALELLWGTQQRPKRGPKPSLSLDRIVAEAIALVDAQGLANLSMQHLAQRLGCAKMALYRYVPGKAELTALMLDTAMGVAPDLASAADNSTEEPMRAQLRLWVEAIFEQMNAHPWMQETSLGARPLGPNEISWLEAALTPLADSGLSGAERLDAIALLAGHARALAQQVAGGDSANLETSMIGQLAHTLAAQADRFPHTLAALRDPTPPGAGNNALHFGVDRILDGLAALIATRTP